MRNYYMGMGKVMEEIIDLDKPVINPGDGFDPGLLGPPIQHDDGIVKDYANPPGGKDIIPENQLRGYDYYGQVTDAENGDPLPGASVILYANGNNLGGQAADGNGYFSFSTNQEADTIAVSNAGYETKYFGGTVTKHDFPLQRKSGDLPPVVLPPVTIGKKGTWLIIGIVGLIVAKNQKWI